MLTENKYNLDHYLFIKGLLSVLVVVVLAMGIAAPVVLKVTEDATNLNMKEDVFKRM